jgi:hypothetical protein
MNPSNSEVSTSKSISLHSIVYTNGLLVLHSSPKMEEHILLPVRLYSRFERLFHILGAVPNIINLPTRNLFQS